MAECLVLGSDAEELADEVARLLDEPPSMTICTYGWAGKGRQRKSVDRFWRCSLDRGSPFRLPIRQMGSIDMGGREAAHRPSAPRLHADLNQGCVWSADSRVRIRLSPGA